jgi:hypothetical protein
MKRKKNIGPAFGKAMCRCGFDVSMRIRLQNPPTKIFKRADKIPLCGTLINTKYLDELALVGLKVCVENPLVLASFCGENTERLSRLGHFFRLMISKIGCLS